MALTKCPDCGREVSERAPACPGCGAPIAGVVPNAAPSYRPVQTIEETGKRWKKLQLLGTGEVFLALFGFGFIDTQPTAAGLWIVGLVALGFGTLIYARIGAWWHHR